MAAPAQVASNPTPGRGTADERLGDRSKMGTWPVPDQASRQLQFKVCRPFVSCNEALADSFASREENWPCGLYLDRFKVRFSASSPDRLPSDEVGPVPTLANRRLQSSRQVGPVQVETSYTGLLTHCCRPDPVGLLFF